MLWMDKLFVKHYASRRWWYKYIIGNLLCDFSLLDFVAKSVMNSWLFVECFVRLHKGLVNLVAVACFLDDCV